jgi:hypothetical protein
VKTTPPIGTADSLQYLRSACSGEVFVSILA